MDGVKSPSKLAGNKFWKLRTVHGREKIFANADLLRAEAQLYFDWCDRNPRERAELVKYQGFAVEEKVSLGRPYSMDGLTLYLGVSDSYFRGAKQNLNDRIEKGKATQVDIDILDCIHWLEKVCRTEQIEGAIVGIYKESTINKLNGLFETVNVNNSTPVLRVTVRDAETEKDLEDLANSLI